MGSLSLHNVVVHHEYFLVVILTRYGVRYLHDVDKLVYHDYKPLIPRADKERGEQLYIIVPVFIGYYGINAEVALRLGARGVFPPEPAHRHALNLIVSVTVGAVIRVDDRREIEPVHHILQTADNGVYLLFHRNIEKRVGRRRSLRNNVGLNAVYPLFKDKRERPAVGLRLDRKAAHKLAVGRKPLTL